MTTKLEEQVERVNVLRKLAQTKIQKATELREHFQDKHTAVFDAEQKARRDLAEAEDTLRQLALNEYKQTKDLHPTPGVDIRVFKVLAYDPDLALEWAKEHKIALKLDTTAFEKVCKSDNSTRPAFVKEDDDPKVYVAKDLDAILNDKENQTE